MNAETYLRQMMQLPGLDEMKAVLEQWDQVAANLKSNPADHMPLVPNLLWKTWAGAGKTHFLRLFSEYLCEARLLDFYGDVKFFEFYLEYCPPHERPTELTRLIEDMKGAAGFRSRYRGVLAIDISAWKGCFKEPNFVRVMEYLSSVDDAVCIVFIVENFRREDSARAEQILNTFFRLRCVEFPYPPPIRFAAYMAERLRAYRIGLGEDAIELLAESIEELMKSDYFDGYKTVNRLYQDIAFELCALPRLPESPVGAEYLTAYRKDSSFVKTLSELAEMRSIGFGGERK